MTAQRFALEVKELHRGDKHEEVGKLQKYLTKYGYLTTTVTPGQLDDATSDALRMFQGIGGISATGELDPSTVDALEQPRCGVPDLPTVNAARRGQSADFVLRGCNYSKLTFTYRFTDGTDDITGTEERAAVRRAFATWASVLRGVSFRQVSTANSDFVIGWHTGDHRDGSAFDGVGNTLAHAFYPPPCGGANAGSLHYDDAETWSLTGNAQTFDAETVTLHEIGHLLGLDHSAVPGAVMFRSYGGVRRSLTQDDIDGIRRLYPALERRGDSAEQAGFVGEISAARHNDNHALTAVRTQAGTLKLIGWRLNPDGSVSRTGDSAEQAGAATSIALARSTTGDRFVTACRTGAGDLKLISWSVSNDGTSIQRRGESGNQAGAATLIRVVPASPLLWTTACRNGSGNLSVIVWSLKPDGSFARLADSGNQADEVRDVDMAVVDTRLVLTAVRDGSDNLKLILWRVTDQSVQRLGDSGNQAGNSRLVKVFMDPSGVAVTAVRTASDTLKLITWRVQPSGMIQRLGDSGELAGITNGHDVGAAPDGRLATSVITEAGTLKVILWQVAGDGAVTRWGDSDDLAGVATLPALIEPQGQNVLTAVRTASSTLRLITWGT
ncbi:matrixin family metalloprotease [Streptomyces lincolnensis]|uniref:matrixin family metalloprotease n=1 Tax=Streptomyces lincolnensis TaxID=1915 RepID=UPI0037CF3705